MSELFNAIYLTTPARRFVGVSLVTGLALSYAKPEIMFDKGKSSEKIDPIVAGAMAYRRAMVAPRRSSGSALVY